MPRVLGLDLSLRGTGLALVPADWDLDWSRVVTHTIGKPLSKDATERERVERLQFIAGRTLVFAREVHATHVWVEEYAFSARASQAHALGELGGVVKAMLVGAGFPVAVVPPARARALLGKLPRKDVKAHVRGLLTKMGAPTSWEGDEADAFVVANWGLSELGQTALIARAA